MVGEQARQTGTFSTDIGFPVMLLRFFYALALSVTLVLSGPAVAQDCQLDRWHCTDTINPGLGDAPRDLDRSTPHATLEALVGLSRNGDWDGAAHLLNLTDLPEEEQRRDGPRLARELNTVISRKVVVDWGSIVDRPDGIDERADPDTPLAGQPRKSILLWKIDLPTHTTSIRLNRIKPGGDEPIWVVSSQTVDDIPALFDAFGPSEFERLLPDNLRKQAAFGLMWWEVIALPLVLFAAGVIGRIVWVLLQRAGRHSNRQLVGEVLHAIRGPSAVGAATGFAFYFSSQAFVFSGLVNAFFSPLAWLGLVGSGLWLFVNAVEVVLDRFTNFDDTDITKGQEAHARTVATRIAAARRAFVVAVVLIGGGVFLTQTTLFQNLGFTLLGTAGAITLVLGFAARRVLGNIMASLQIALNGSAKIGDRIVYKEYLCHVERINFTFVQLRDWDGTRLVVPVEEFVSTPFENWTMKEPEMLRIIKLKFSHEADVEELRSIFDNIIPELDQSALGDLDLAKVRVAEQDVFGKGVWFALPCNDPNTSWDVACLAREKIIASANRLAERRNVVMFPDANPAEAA